jgi:uncharacterized protein YggT (Ycf19 family)
MSERVEKVRETTDSDGNVQRTKIVRDGVADRDHKQNVAQRVVWYIAGVILVLLAFRFLLSLLGANPGNGFADFIYGTSEPLVSPFFSLFNYDFDNGTSRLEVFTLVAMAVYAVVAWGISKLVSINQYNKTDA